MPLINSGSKKAVSENIRELHTGKTFAHTASKFGKQRADKQAVAIALNVARKAKRAVGGALPKVGGMGPKISIPKPIAPFKMPTTSPPFYERSEARGLAFSRPNLSALKADGGATGLAPMKMPWQAQQEARSLAHTGPILSAVPGRTDNHAISVPSSSYILPADHVSSLGQGNTLAGMKILSRMFPNSAQRGGAGAMPMRGGVLSDRGGARGHGTGNVPIMAAGGEFSVSPQDVAMVGGGDVNRGHAVLDEWVKANRKKHIRTLSKLPPPAKS